MAKILAVDDEASNTVFGVIKIVHFAIAKNRFV